MTGMIRIEVLRQDSPQATPYWQKFALPYEPQLNVIAVLMKLREQARDADGQPVAPVAWDAACLDEICGACSMVINGKPRQACSALIDSLEQPIKLQPLSKFPVVRDLVVDRSSMFEARKRFKTWVSFDGTDKTGPGPKVKPELQDKLYKFSRCFSCGLCLEVCPEIRPNHPFVGPEALVAAHYFNEQPLGKLLKDERIKEGSKKDGIEACGKQETCQKVCPKGVPILEGLAGMRQSDAWGFFG